MTLTFGEFRQLFCCAKAKKIIMVLFEAVVGCVNLQQPFLCLELTWRRLRPRMYSGACRCCFGMTQKVSNL